ncbi:DUF4411 family protein [Corynebacterium felinum]|uniref:PIN domain-containing protein n=1 Tax=Corynebacterium felinum TaxID=131318 RepID=A0ABU2BC92_9CORY|nr:DUF4411 family protein [Corynebacterium felinum]MDF5820681.1 DUF4411 family protein [Corynebacterium felinum]MDR7356255.1 hypothetical protein [Corynebacterium felinum]WJY95587.1 hypothetical protein CFELI_09930 [Corynebacterium felinum]
MYLIDANVLMTAADTHYPEDVVPSFWLQILDLLNSGEAKIPQAVYNELIAYQQKWLFQWVKNNVISDKHVLTEDLNQILNLAKVTEWVTNQRKPEYRIHHREKFLAGADPRIIAAAMSERAQIVTYEKAASDPNSRKVKIPEVAAEFNVTCISPIEMLRACNRRL